jgi:hypothetical protein
VYPPLRFLRPSSVAPSGVRLPSNEQRTPGQGTQGLQPTAPEYSGVSRSRRVLLVPRSGRVNCSLLTLLLTTGVSSFPGLAKLGSLGGCNPRPGRSIVRSTPGGLPPSLRDRGAPYRTNCLRRRGSFLLEAKEPLPASWGVRRCPHQHQHSTL